MKRNASISIVLYFLLIIDTASCQSQKTVKLSIEKRNNFPEFILPDERSKFPVAFVAGESDTIGSISFETSSARTCIKGKPSSVRYEPESFEAQWIIDKRLITIKFVKRDNYTEFSFQAQPNVDILKWAFGIKAIDGEYFTGLFERTVDGDQEESWKEGITAAMDLRGQQVSMLVKPTTSLYCPFYISSSGYGLFIEGTWPGKYDFCKTDSERVLIEFEGTNLSGKIYTSPNPADIIKANALHVGPTIVPPIWAFLPWRWRDKVDNNKSYYDGTPVKAPYNSQLVEDILMMKAFDIPCGAYWVDRPWAKDPQGYADFDWDPHRFPQAENMIKWIHDQDMRFLLWIAPWVSGNMSKEAYKKGYTQPMEPYDKIDSINRATIDFTNPAACAWWQENGIEKMLGQGVDGFKLDRAEENIPETRDIILFNGKTSREMRNHYPVNYVRVVNESCRKIKGDDFVIFPRAGYTGSARYGVFWGGDIGAPPEGLRAAIIAIQRSAVIGYPIWGSDIGGYAGNLDREICARWLAFGCFNPIMEFGPTENRAPWDMDSEIKYDTALIAIWRLYAKVHVSLAELSLQLAKEAHETGMPIVRPLFMVYPEQKESWTEWQNMLYGPDILIHAIWRKGDTKARVYLPKGERWKDAWNPDKIYDGGQFIELNTPLHMIPIFLREGTKINLGDLNKLYFESLEIARVKPDLRELEKSVK